MQEPILEALIFAYDGIEISEGGAGHVHKSTTTLQLDKALQDFSAQFTTPCPFNTCDFKLVGLTDPLSETYSTTQEFLKHLLVQHNLVVDNVPSIANLHRYLVCLGDIFSNPDFQLENYCVGFWMDQPLTTVEAVQRDTLPEGSGSSQNVETRHKYYMLTPEVPEDKALRTQLWSQRLESVLEINRLEREQNDFSYNCPLFCKEVCKGNRANLFLHMAEEHAFHVGQPDNIVFVKDFLLQIEKQLQELKCIYCEKTFKDRVTLKEHMRKKLHKRINPLNPEYDRFYMVNYLEVGKTWQALQEEDNDEERIEEDWVELKDEKNQIICLLCPQQLDSFDQTLDHMKHTHCFDFKALTTTYDFYQKVKFVNFIRRNVYQSRCFYCDAKYDDKGILTQHIEEHQFSNSVLPNGTVWDQSEYLFPTYENDEFLMFLGDGDEDESTQASANNQMDTTMSDRGNPTIIPEDISEIIVPPVVQLPADLDLDLI